MTKMSTLILVLALAPTAALAEPADPSGYNKFKIAYTEQRQFESKAFRACLVKAEKADRTAKPALQEEVMPRQTNCMAAETDRLFANLNSNFSFDMIREDHEAGLSVKWATVPNAQPDMSAIEKLRNDQQAWMDTLDKKCMANFDIKTDDPKIVMPYFESCKLTETVRRTIWYQRNRANQKWHLVAENKLVDVHP
jgi:uncharacterized protein YecT (DUF1311 family)